MANARVASFSVLLLNLILICGRANSLPPDYDGPDIDRILEGPPLDQIGDPNYYVDAGTYLENMAKQGKRIDAPSEKPEENKDGGGSGGDTPATKDKDPAPGVNKEELSWLVKGTSTTEASEEKTSNQSRPSGAGSESSGGEIPLGRIDDGQKDKPSSGSRSGGEDGTSYRRPADVSREYPYDYGDRRPDYPGPEDYSGEDDYYDGYGSSEAGGRRAGAGQTTPSKPPSTTATTTTTTTAKPTETREWADVQRTGSQSHGSPPVHSYQPAPAGWQGVAAYQQPAMPRVVHHQPKRPAPPQASYPQPSGVSYNPYTQQQHFVYPTQPAAQVKSAGKNKKGKKKRKNQRRNPNNRLATQKRKSQQAPQPLPKAGKKKVKPFTQEEFFSFYKRPNRRTNGLDGLLMRTFF